MAVDGDVGCVIDGVPPRRPLCVADLQADLGRRSATSTDEQIDMKYGIRSVQGGGRTSARETIGSVAAGVVAKKIHKDSCGTEILAYVSQVHKVVLPEDLVDHYSHALDQMESNIVRCPDPEYAEKMIAAIDTVRGLSSNVFDKLEAELAKAGMPLPATKGFEFGSGFAGTFPAGTEHNDEFFVDEQGESGQEKIALVGRWEIINMRIAFKPTARVARNQNTVTTDKQEVELIPRGCDYPCFVVPMVLEAGVALVILDQLLAQYDNLFPQSLLEQEAKGKSS